jgi:YD repeat-containing protein
MKNTILIIALICGKQLFAQLYTAPEFKGHPKLVVSTYTLEPDSTGYNHSTLNSYTYDGQGLLTHGMFDGGHGEIISTEYAYKNGQVVKITGSTNGKVTGKSMYKYDDNGQCISYITGKEKTEYRYNEQHLISETNEYYDGKINLQTRYTYNDSGLCTLEESSDPIEHVTFANITTSYNEKGQPTDIAYRFMYDTTSNFSVSYRYDDAGNLEKSIRVNAENKITSSSKFDYDDHGNIVREKSMWFDTETGQEMYSTYTYAYEYDEQGNWVKMTTWLDDKPYAEEVRTIVYY